VLLEGDERVLVPLDATQVLAGVRLAAHGPAAIAEPTPSASPVAAEPAAVAAAAVEAAASAATESSRGHLDLGSSAQTENLRWPNDYRQHFGLPQNPRFLWTPADVNHDLIFYAGYIILL
jgi:hypothetical protein